MRCRLKNHHHLNPTLFPFFFFQLGVWLVILRKFLMGRPLRITSKKLESMYPVPGTVLAPNSVHLQFCIGFLAVSGTSYTLRTGFPSNAKNRHQTSKKAVPVFLAHREPTSLFRAHHDDGLIITPRSRTTLRAQMQRGSTRRPKYLPSFTSCAAV